MYIPIVFKIHCLGFFYEKGHIVLFVKNEKDIDKLHELLCERNSEWKDKKHFIRLIPEMVSSLDELNKMCQYANKCSIGVSQIEEIKKEVDFIIYQRGMSDYDY